MMYDIKAIPTTYAGVNFRSRLEARWAAFFDLCGWKWDYEPFDLHGWAPDFKIILGGVTCLAEVKPVDAEEEATEVLAEAFEKAFRHAASHNILLLCDGPRDFSVGIPVRKYEPSDQFVVAVKVTNAKAKWREAGNRVQWGAEKPQASIQEIVRRAVQKARSAA